MSERKLPPWMPVDPVKLLSSPWRRKAPPVAPFGATIANFQRRMLAAMLDTALLMLLLGEPSRYITTFLAGPLHIDPEAWRAAQDMIATSKERNAKLVRLWIEGGGLRRWVTEFLFQLGMMMAYSYLCWRCWAATPGKMLMRIRIADAVTGAPPAPAQCLKRLLAYLLSGAPLLLGFFWIAWNKRRQGWHDQLAHTLVVTIPWRKAKPESEAQPPVQPD